MDPYRELLATMAVIAAGAMLGRLAIRGVRLDMTAMLLVGALFAHFGVALSPSLGVFGLLLFLYTVGTQAGPSLRAMHRQDVHVAAASVAVLWILMAATYAIGGWIGLPTELRLGTMAGFFSSGASLALIQGRFGAEEGTAAGFALATPLCTLMVMILVQAWHARLQPRLGPELARWNEQMRRDSEPAMAARIRVTNPGAFGRTLAELKLPCTVLWILRANEHVPPRGDHHPNPPGRDRSASPGRLPLPLGRPGAGQRAGRSGGRAGSPLWRRRAQH
jgi:putative transport protein